MVMNQTFNDGDSDSADAKTERDLIKQISSNIGS
jgi:hypothetical protein